MGLAIGGRTYKLKFGHRGANHPVKFLDSGRVEITSQNHGFAVDPDSLPADARVTHLNLYDGTVTSPRSRCSIIPRHRPARTTRTTCSGSSWTR